MQGEQKMIWRFLSSQNVLFVFVGRCCSGFLVISGLIMFVLLVVLGLEEVASRGVPCVRLGEGRWTCRDLCLAPRAAVSIVMAAEASHVDLGCVSRLPDLSVSKKDQ
jgi:hypothetical protein